MGRYIRDEIDAGTVMCEAGRQDDMPQGRSSSYALFPAHHPTSCLRSYNARQEHGPKKVIQLDVEFAQFISTIHTCVVRCGNPPFRSDGMALERIVAAPLWESADLSVRCTLAAWHDVVGIERQQCIVVVGCEVSVDRTSAVDD